MTSGPPFRGTFEISVEDMVDYLRVAQRTLNIFGVGASVVGAAYGVYVASHGDIPLGVVMVAMGTFLLAASATRFFDRFRARRVGKRILGTTASFVIDEGGIDSNTVAGQAHFPWSAADNISESAQVMILRRGRMTVVWMPKRAFGAPAERDALLAFVRAHVGAAAGEPAG